LNHGANTTRANIYIHDKSNISRLDQNATKASDFDDGRELSVTEREESDPLVDKKDISLEPGGAVVNVQSCGQFRTKSALGLSPDFNYPSIQGRPLADFLLCVGYQ
jgi:hypothetical protein